ncbi:hypothetical protein ZWY2020_037906 [Hordeum vulgare]|nr:hypothetical protein ZWY2020_037906 [Hordeum vulgare]
MAVDAPTLHAHSNSGRSDGAGTVAPWPSLAAPTQVSLPKCKGMLTWPGQQGPAGSRHGVRKERKRGTKELPKAALPVAPTQKAPNHPGGDSAVDGIRPAGGLSLANGGLAAAAVSNPGAPPTTEEDPVGSALAGRSHACQIAADCAGPKNAYRWTPPTRSRSGKVRLRSPLSSPPCHAPLLTSRRGPICAPTRRGREAM